MRPKTHEQRKKGLVGLGLGVLVGWLTLCGAGARADTTAPSLVKTVWQYTQPASSGHTFLYLDGVDCVRPDSPYRWFVIRSDDPKQNSLFSIASAAFLARRPVILEFEPSTCRVLSMKLHSP